LKTTILIIRFSSIGDIVLTTPVVRALKTQLEGEVEIHYITKKAFADLIRSNPSVDKVITIEEHVSEAKAELQKVQYDYIVDLHNNLRSRQVKRIAKGLAFTVDKRNVAKWLYVLTKKLILPIGHIVDRNLATVKALGIEDDGQGLDFFIRDEERIAKTQIPDWYLPGFVTYAIGGLTMGKILPVEKAIELINQINKPVALLGGKSDFERGEIIAKACGAKVWNTCGLYSLQQSASLLELSETVITHDTGLMHIASALNKKVVSLWFSTTPELGFAPWRPGAGSVMIEADCHSRPTSKLGNRGYENECVFNIDLTEIARVVNG
jgi:ADP-heptose:LPS heptosyltransferase